MPVECSAIDCSLSVGLADVDALADPIGDAADSEPLSVETQPAGLGGRGEKTGIMKFTKNMYETRARARARARKRSTAVSKNLV